MYISIIPDLGAKRKQDMWLPKVHWPASLAEPLGSVRDPVSKIRWKMSEEDNPHWPPASVPLCTHVCASTHPHASEHVPAQQASTDT